MRGQNVYNLGKVKRLYLEACGDFSTYKEKDDKPGLSILPENDEAVHGMQKIPKEDIQVCSSCGHTGRAMVKEKPCPVCDEKLWETAII